MLIFIDLSGQVIDCRLSFCLLHTHSLKPFCAFLPIFQDVHREKNGALKKNKLISIKDQKLINRSIFGHKFSMIKVRALLNQV